MLQRKKHKSLRHHARKSFQNYNPIKNVIQQKFLEDLVGFARIMANTFSNSQFSDQPLNLKKEKASLTKVM